MAVGTSCPAFSWGGVAGAAAYEIAAYRIAAGDDKAERVLRQRLPGTAFSWTPELARCLEAGERYAWAVRAVDESGRRGEWSEASLFEIAEMPTAAEVGRALAVLRAYLERTVPAPPGVAAEDAAATAPDGAAGSTGTRQAGPGSWALATADKTAFTAEVADTSGVVFGMHGISRSTGDGSVGVAGQSTATSGDVAGVHGQVASAAGAAGVFDNTAAGDILRGLAGGVEVFSVEGSGAVVATSFDGDGSALTGVSADEADTLDGVDSGQFLRSDQSDAFASGTLTAAAGTTLDVDGALDASGATALTFPTTGISGAGLGSGLDGDTVDGLHASAFMSATTDNWVDEAGDTMTGTLYLSPGAGNALEVQGDILVPGYANLRLDGSVLRGGALFLHTQSHHGTALGQEALAAATGTDNTAIGYRALYSTTSGTDNTALGHYALRDNEGSANTALGEEALVHNTTGSGSTAVGSGALHYSLSGGSNTALGYRTLWNNTTGSLNLALGDRAGYYATVGDYNVFIANAGAAGDDRKMRIGAAQTATYIAGIYGTSLSGSAVVVTASGQLGVASGATGDADTLDGVDSAQFLRSDQSDSFGSGTLTTAAGTTLDVDGALDAAGATALTFPTTGISGAGHGSGLDADLLDGNHASAFMSAATDNWVDEGGDTMSGDLALGGNDLVNLGEVRKAGHLFLHETGYGNLGLGSRAIPATTTGYNNTAVGTDALRSHTSGHDNTAIGYDALYANTTGSYNAGLGHDALVLNTSGHSNTAVGKSALRFNTTGARNIAVGMNAGGNLTTGSDNIHIGNQGMTGEAAKIRLGTQGTQTATYIAGISGVTPAGATEFVVVDGSGQLGSTASVPDGALSASVAHLDVAETITANWVNTANPWADNEVSDTLTIGAGGSVADGALSSNVSLLGPSIEAGEISDGPGSTLDADTVDGLQAAALVMKAGDTMSGTLNLPANGLTVGTNQLVAANGRVGIGTASPNYRTDIVATGSQMRLGSNTSDEGMYLLSVAANNFNVAGGASHDGTNWIARDSIVGILTHGSGGLGFYADSGLTVGSTFVPTERMRLLSSGNLGIGTTTPAARLEVSSVMRLTPTDAPGTCDASLEGGVYYDDSMNEPCFCDGTGWAQFDGGGACV